MIRYGSDGIGARGASPGAGLPYEEVRPVVRGRPTSEPASERYESQQSRETNARNARLQTQRSESPRQAPRPWETLESRGADTDRRSVTASRNPSDDRHANRHVTQIGSLQPGPADIGCFQNDESPTRSQYSKRFAQRFQPDIAIRRGGIAEDYSTTRRRFANARDSRFNGPATGHISSANPVRVLTRLSGLIS